MTVFHAPGQSVAAEDDDGDDEDDEMDRRQGNEGVADLTPA